MITFILPLNNNNINNNQIITINNNNQLNSTYICGSSARKMCDSNLNTLQVNCKKLLIFFFPFHFVPKRKSVNQNKIFHGMHFMF